VLLVIIGTGFAGMYVALSSARLRDIEAVSPEALEIALVAPEPTLVVRPRLYEPKPDTLTAPLQDVLRPSTLSMCKRRLELVVNCQASAIVTEPHDLTRRVTRRACTHGHKERLAPTLLTCPFFVRTTSAAANTRTIASTANVSLKPRISDCRRMIFPRATRA